MIAKFAKDRSFKYKFIGEQIPLEESGNTCIKLAHIVWNFKGEDDEEIPEDKICLDIRKYVTTANGEERMMKGVSFRTRNGVNELTHTLINQGYGETYDILKSISDRTDFGESVRAVVDNDPPKNNTDEDPNFDLRDFL